MATARRRAAEAGTCAPLVPPARPTAPPHPNPLFCNTDSIISWVYLRGQGTGQEGWVRERTRLRRLPDTTNWAHQRARCCNDKW